MKSLPWICWIFIIGLMAENSQQGKKIRDLQADVEAIQSDVRVAYEALNNIRNSAPNIKVFSDDDFESVDSPGVEVLNIDFETGEVDGTKIVSPEEVMKTDD